MHQRISFLMLTTIILQGYAKTIDNRLLGSPTVTCGPDEIRIEATSEETFEGQVYIKTQRRISDCFTLYSSDDNSTTPYFSIPLNRISSCGLTVNRNSESRALEIVAIFVFAFHPSFVTQGDRAFAVHCLFQQHQYTVGTQFDFIGDLHTKAVLGATSTVPAVQLSIVSGRVPFSDDRLGQVAIGHPLMFVWTIEGGNSLVYGIRVISCSAESKDGKKMLIIDSGCTHDNNLISDVRYADDFQRAFADGTAFKFPDMEEVWFRCHVQLCIRRFEHLVIGAGGSGDVCVAEQKCPSSPTRHARSSPSSHSHFGVPSDDVIVVNGRLSVSEDGYGNEYSIGKNRPQRQVSPSVSTPPTVCLPRQLFSVFTALSATVYCLTIGVISAYTCLQFKRERVLWF